MDGRPPRAGSLCLAFSLTSEYHRLPGPEGPPSPSISDAAVRGPALALGSDDRGPCAWYPLVRHALHRFPGRSFCKWTPTCLSASPGNLLEIQVRRSHPSLPPAPADAPECKMAQCLHVSYARVPHLTLNHLWITCHT